MKKPLSYLIVFFCLSISALSPAKDNPVPNQQQDYQPLKEALIYSDANVKIFPIRFPDSFNCFMNPSKSSCYLFSLLFESMLTINEVTQELEPNLANSWSISEDGRTIEFMIKEDIFWSDGVPITAEDVLFTLTMLMQPGSLNFGKKIDYMRFEAEIISADVIRFTTDDVDWRNLPLLGFLHILPAHAFRDVDIMQARYNFNISSGQYVIEDIRIGSTLILKRNDNWLKGAADNTHATRLIWVFSNEAMSMPYCECYTENFRNNLWNIQPESYGPENGPFRQFDLDDLSPLQKQKMRDFLEFLGAQQAQTL